MYSNCFVFFFFLLANRLTELLEDFQKIISAQVDENDEKTLAVVSKDFKTLQSLWNKFRQEGPGQTLAGRRVDFGTFFKKTTKMLAIFLYYYLAELKKKDYFLGVHSAYY